MHHSQPGTQVYVENNERNQEEREKEKERLILLLCNVCQLSSEKTDAVCRHEKRKDSQQGHQMSVFNIDSIFSSSVRYPERYVLKPEIIICRLKNTRCYRRKCWLSFVGKIFSSKANTCVKPWRGFLFLF